MADMNHKRRTTEKQRRRRRQLSATAAAYAAVTILSTVSLPQHAVLATSSPASSAGHYEDDILTSDHRRRKLAEQRRRMAERRHLLEEKWTTEAILNLQTCDYVLDETDTSNIPRHYIVSRDGTLRSPDATRVDEDIISLEEADFESSSSGGDTVVHHQKSKLGPTNNGHLQPWSPFQHWQSGDRNLRGGSIIIHEDDNEDMDEITFIYDEDDPEEDLDGYDLVYVGNGDNVHLHQRQQQQQQRELSLAESFVNKVKEGPKGKLPPTTSPQGKPPPPIGMGRDELLSFGSSKILTQMFPITGSIIGTIQAFGAQVEAKLEIKSVKIQFKNDHGKRSNWKILPRSSDLTDWYMREMSGFTDGENWKYRMKAKTNTRQQEITIWMELAINVNREDTPNPTPLPTTNPTPWPSPGPTTPPSPRPSPGPTSPPSPQPSPQPTPGPTLQPTPDPTPYPVDSSSEWTKHPTKHPTTTSPPSPGPTPVPSRQPSPGPTSPPSPQPSPQPTPGPTSPPTSDPTPQPTEPPTQEATEAVQQAPSKLLTRYVRDDAWEYGGKIQYSSGRVLFFFDGDPFVCTGTVIDDGDTPDRTLILTAGHCAFKYDNNGGKFADYALFIPNQDETRGAGTDEKCSNDPMGCWTLAFALVDYEWSRTSFPASVPWDYAIYVIQNVPQSHQPGFVYKDQPELSSTLEDVVTKFPIDFIYNQKTAPATHTHGMGYTFIKDPDFRYCAKDLSTKYGISSYENLWLSVCDMSGGSSGGAWMKDTKDDGTGTIISVNSWGYSSSTGMAGPNFHTEGGSKVECLFEKAKVVDFDDAKDGGVIVRDC